MNDILQSCPSNNFKTIYNKVKLIYVFGDIHGDYDVAISMFKLSKTIDIIDNSIKWIGGDAIIVQIGDQIDGCRPSNNLKCEDNDKNNSNDIKVLNLFTYINTLAQKDGGLVISLLGNHEIMNVQGNINYVSKNDLLLLDNNISIAKQKRIDLFKQGNKYAKILACTRQSCVIIGSHLFVHAGIIDKLISYFEKNKITDLHQINIYIKLWLLGLNPNVDLSVILNDTNMSPFWIRDLGLLHSNLNLDNEKCNIINKTLSFYQINDIVIGHTPQSFLTNTDINSTCGRTIWRVDNGSSNAFDLFDHTLTETGNKSYNRRCQILKIVDDNKYELLYFDNNQIISKSI